MSNVSLSYLRSAMILLVVLTTSARAQPQPLTTENVFAEPSIDAAKSALAKTFANLVEQGIPRQYEKRKDWGKTKNITVGLHADGLKLRRRKRPVKHGVWKHYRVSQIDADKNLGVRINNLHVVDGGRVAFMLVVDGKIDAWARAKVYQYGIHLIAIEVVADTNFELLLDCEVGVRLQTESGSPGIVIDPRVLEARAALPNFRLHRVSNAKGPLVRELSSSVREVIEDGLKGPKLVAKLNRAIDKKRDRLEFNLGDLLGSSWWPLAQLPDVHQLQHR